MKDFQIVPVTFDVEQEIWIKECAQLYCQLWQEPPWNEFYWTSEQVIQDMQRELAMPSAQCFMAMNPEVIGFTWGYSVDRETLREISQGDHLDRLFSAQARVYYIDELGVSSSHRGKGIGKELTTHLTLYAQSQGHTIVTLRTDKQAMEARSVYAKLGFVELPVIDSRYPDRSYWFLML